MAERIVSPGVFTQEKDLSFLPQGIAEIGAAIVGPTKKGPAFVPTILRNFQQFEEMFGGLDKDLYVPFTAREYLRSAGTVTIVRVLGLGGYSTNHVQIAAHHNETENPQILAILAPSALVASESTPLAGVVASGSMTAMNITTGSYQFSSSLDPASSKYIGDVFSANPLTTKAQGNDSPFYLYKIFGTAAAALAAVSSSSEVTASVSSLSHLRDYQSGSTPMITSQKLGGSPEDLFKVSLRSHGEVETNTHYKIAILNIKQASDVAGSDYGTFSLQVRAMDQTTFKESDDTIVEQYDNLTLDPSSVNFIARRIGDRSVSIDTEGKLTYNGDWPNVSKYIVITNYDSVKKGSVAKNLVPYGCGAVNYPVSASTVNTASNGVVTASFVDAQVNSSTSEFDTSVFYGFKFSEADNRQYLGPITSDANLFSNVTFSLDDMSGHISASSAKFNGSSTFSSASQKISLGFSNIAQRKFVVPIQGGFDGSNPAIEKKTAGDITATNQQGFDCSTSETSGSVAYKRALNAISNQDEFDINMLTTPGLIYTLHPNPINHAIDMVEQRGDAFYVFDPSAWSDSISSTTSAVTSLDTNYAACYYPWVKVLDDNLNLPVWVPPSVVLPGVFSQNDNVSHEWFAPAGLNRGGLRNVLEAKTRLTHGERDILYEDRVNPIASFPGQGVVVFGQKTLQAKPSALDRINVRRLLIRLKKFIASTSRFLVFEQNTVATRNRFMNIVNPFLESVQSNSGLTAFRVVMDDSNNTPDVVDRNQLVGQIFIQPARSVEFIVLDFVVQPSGATFPS